VRHTRAPPGDVQRKFPPTTKKGKNVARARERFYVDVVYEGLELSSSEREEIAGKIAAIAHVTALGEEREPYVNFKVVKVSGGHQHESTDDHMCPGCVRMARDERNSGN
jgi:hypothetical protein